jgi:hypothetical protein
MGPECDPTGADQSTCCVAVATCGDMKNVKLQKQCDALPFDFSWQASSLYLNQVCAHSEAPFDCTVLGFG